MKALLVMVVMAVSAFGVGCGSLARYAVDETKEAVISYMKDEALPAIKEQVNNYVDQKIKEQETKEIEKLNAALAEFDSKNSETGILEGKRAMDFDLNKDGSLNTSELAAIGTYMAVKRASGHGSNTALLGGGGALAALIALEAAKKAKGTLAKKAVPPEPAKT